MAALSQGRGSARERAAHCNCSACRRMREASTDKTPHTHLRRLKSRLILCCNHAAQHPLLSRQIIGGVFFSDVADAQKKDSMPAKKKEDEPWLRTRCSSICAPCLATNGSGRF